MFFSVIDFKANGNKYIKRYSIRILLIHSLLILVRNQIRFFGNPEK